MRARPSSIVVAAVAASLAACGGAKPAPVAPASPPVAATATAAPQVTAAPPPAPAPAPAPKRTLDAARVGSLTGGKPETSADVVKVSFPREDVKVDVAGYAKMPPFMGLTSWAAFTPGEKPGVEAMVMGDLVLFEDEVNPVMSAALAGGLEVTALHNHFFFDRPHVYFMHVGGEGALETLASGVKAALDAERAVRAKAPKPASSFGAPAVPTKSAIDGAKLDAIFGVQGTSKLGMYKAVFGRETKAECGCTVGKAMGVNTWAAFAGTDANAVVDGDFAVSEDELQPVLKALRAGGVNVVAIHSHMTHERPRILFLHYWGRGAASALAATVRRALDLTAWDGRTTST